MPANAGIHVDGRVDGSSTHTRDRSEELSSSFGERGTSLCLSKREVPKRKRHPARRTGAPDRAASHRGPHSSEEPRQQPTAPHMTALFLVGTTFERAVLDSPLRTRCRRSRRSAFGQPAAPELKGGETARVDRMVTQRRLVVGNYWQAARTIGQELRACRR